MTYSSDEILISQLADGELDSDLANALLLRVLDEPASREVLRDVLTMRADTLVWRGQKPAGGIVALQPPRRRPLRRSWMRLGSLAAAAVIGGLLVMSGSWLAAIRNPQDLAPNARVERPLVFVGERVSDDARRDVAKAFALHESVAGPLKWYAAGDEQVKLATASEPEAKAEPVGLVLRLRKLGADGQGDVRTYSIVCRNGQDAMMEVPETADMGMLRLGLRPSLHNGTVVLRYALSIEGGGADTPAALAGQRSVNLQTTALGQIALANQLYQVEATAWPIRERR